MSCSIKSIRPKQWSHGLTHNPLLAETTPVHNKGNDIADSLAKENRSKHIPDIVVPLELKEIYAQVDTHIMNKWQTKWENGTTGREYFKMEGSVSDKTKYSHDVKKQ